MRKTSAGISTRLQELYKVMAETEKKALARYLASPFLNTDERLLQLHRLLVQAMASGTEPGKKEVWQAIAGNKPYNDKSMRYLVSDLLGAIESFIYLQQTLKAKTGYLQAVNDYFTLKGATENRNALAAKIKSGKSSRQPLAPALYLESYFENALLEELHTGLRKEYVKFITARRTSRPDGLDAYYIIEKLRYMCIVATDNRVLGLTCAVFNELQVLKLAGTGALAQNILVQAYTSIYYLVTTQKQQYYTSLKACITNHGYDIGELTLTELFVYARNYCISRINAGDSGYYNQLLGLYQQGIAKNVLLVNGEITGQNFKNIVTTALRTRQYQWAFDFINDYRYHLNKTQRHNAYYYNLANYYFHTKKFEKVPGLLQKVQLTDLFYGLDARMLMLKCYFETDEKEAFMNAYASFRLFVQRRKNVSEQHRKNYLNFLRLAKKLLNLRAGNKAAVEKLYAEIKTARAVADKNWLEEKIQAYTPAAGN